MYQAPKDSSCPQGAPSLLGRWESPGIPSPESKGPRHQLWWLRLHVLSHMALRGGHSWSRERATPTRGSSASFLSGVLGFILGLWPELTPLKKITALGQPQTTGNWVLSAPIAQAFRLRPHLRGEAAYPPGPPGRLGMGICHSSPHCKSEPLD